MSQYRVVADRENFYAQYWTGSGWSRYFWDAHRFASHTAAEDVVDKIEAGLRQSPKERKQDWSTRKKKKPPVISVEEIIPYHESD